jgi:galactitol-specific phosphotransferase system IIC component
MGIKIGLALKKAGRFVKRRLKERSTYIGAAAVAVAVGKPEVADAIKEYADIGFLILGITGGGLIAADTSAPSEPLAE